MGKYVPYNQYKPSGASWIGDVPHEWPVVRLKQAVDLVNEKGTPGSEDKYIGLEHIRSWTGRYVTPDEPVLPESLSNRYFPETVLFGKLRPYLAKSLLRKDAGYCSSELLVLRPRKLVPQYLHYVTLTEGFVKEVNSSTYGAKMPRAGWEFVGGLPVPMPSPFEQRTIAGFLDHETAKIDRLIAKQERLIELLKEKRQAVISHAVTKGLDPDAPMKDSGVEWLGEVPAHWKVAGFKKYLESVVDYRGRTPEKVDDGILLVTARNIDDGKIDYSYSREFIAPVQYEEVMRRGKPRVGDVLFVTEAPLGEVACVDREDVALAQRIIKFRGKDGVLDNYFLKYFIMSASFQSSLTRFATGSTALGIKAERLIYLCQLVPPLSEQKAIVEHIDEEIVKLDLLTQKAGEAIELMREHRTALISAAVTGKIDVRDWKKPEQEPEETVETATA